MKLKKSLALILAFCMVLSSMGTVVFAEDAVKSVNVSTPDDLADALTSDDKNIVVTLEKDIEVPISSLGEQTPGSGEYKLGGENTQKITIDLNQKLLNVTTGYWSALGSVNPDATITIKNGSMVSTGNSAQTWNAYDLRFCNCDWVFEGVTFQKEVALDNAGKSTTMKDVTINGTGNYYALWITAEGQNVTIDGLTVNTPGRGIKIDDQYSDNVEEVELSVSNAAFTTAEKAAIMVKSTKGAKITTTNVDITNVAADSKNLVWVDEDAKSYDELVTVNGNEAYVEGTVYVATYDELIAALEGDASTIIMKNDIVENAKPLTNGYGKTGINILNGETLDGDGHKLTLYGLGSTWDSAINTTGGIIKDLTVNKGFRGIFINHNSSYSAPVVLKNVIIDGPVYTISCDKGTEKGFTATNCTFNGWTSFAKTLGKATFNNSNFGEGSGNAYCRPYAESEFNGCDFEKGYRFDASRTSNEFNECKYDGKALSTGAGAEMFYNGGDITIDGVVSNFVAKPVAYVGLTSYKTLEDAIKAAAPAGTVTLLTDVTVDKWIMFSERLSIGNGDIITLDINGLTIDGNGKTLTVKSIESAGNGNRLFYDATNLNIKDLTINYADGVVGGIGLTSGTISNVKFNGGVGVLPGTGDITITGCEFNTNGSAIYNEDERDNLVVTGNTFNTAAGQYAIYLRGDTTFTDNTVVNGKVNVVSGSPVVIGNDFGTERFKVYNAATATIEDNIINNLVFNDENPVKSSFAGNILSDAARAALAALNFETVAKIGNAEYYTLQAAFEAVEDGQTIKLSKDIVIDENSRYNNGGWFEGAYYEGDESFVIDLNSHTITQNGAVNDYLLLFKNNGSKENEIAIKNGTIDAGTTAYCAICTSTTNSQKLTINTENVNIIGNNDYGSVMKIRGGAVLNVNDGTVITGKDSYLGIENWNATVNIYEGAEIYMNGTTSYNGCLVGVGGNGTINVYGGYGKGVKGAFIAMTSGGIINIYGGEWIADTDGTNVAGNDSVLIAQNDKITYPDANNSVVNVAGGRFIGSYNCYGNAVGDAQINITAGMFDQDPSAYVTDDKEVVKLGDDEGYDFPYIIADKKASAIKVKLAETSTDGLYDIFLVSSDGNPIHEFVAAQFTFENGSTTVGGSTMQYEVLGINEKTTAQKTVVDGEERYIIKIVNAEDPKNRLSGDTFPIGQVKFIGQGNINFSIAKGEVDTTWQETNLGRYYTNADAIDDAADNLLLEGAKIVGGSVADITRNVAIKVTYNHELVAAWDNDEITVTLKDAYGEIVGTDDISDGYAAFNNVKIGRITVTLEAPGFRKFVYETTLDEDDDDTVVLSFWNDVKKENHKLSIEKDATPVAHNFVVGDIVMDYIVDKYDLAAVTSYYGMYDIENEAKYIKYDLNRDGNIDIRDVQYVLHTMGN